MSHSTLPTVAASVYTPLFTTLQSALRTQHATFHTLDTPHVTLHAPHFRLPNPHDIPHSNTLRSTPHTLRFSVQIPFFLTTLSTQHSTLYTLQFQVRTRQLPFPHTPQSTIVQDCSNDLFRNCLL